MNKNAFYNIKISIGTIILQINKKFTSAEKSFKIYSFGDELRSVRKIVYS